MASRRTGIEEILQRITANMCQLLQPMTCPLPSLTSSYSPHPPRNESGGFEQLAQIATLVEGGWRRSRRVWDRG